MKYYLANNNVIINKTENKLCFIQKYPGDIFCCDGNGRQDVLDTFISRNNLVEKTLQEAQSLVNTAITQAQNNYDTLPESEKDLKNLVRPINITLPNSIEHYNTMLQEKIDQGLANMSTEPDPRSAPQFLEVRYGFTEAV